MTSQTKLPPSRVDLGNLHFVSRRVGTYVFSTADATALLDQFWVR